MRQFCEIYGNTVDIEPSSINKHCRAPAQRGKPSSVLKRVAITSRWRARFG
jgi:hypothetical protein